MQAQSTEQFPDSLNGIKLRAVRRQKMEHKVGLLLPAPFGVQFGVVVLGIVSDHDDPASRTRTDPSQVAKKRPARLGVKSPAGLRVAKLAVTKPYRSKVADALTGRGMPAYWIANLRWNPHAASAAMLLEVHLIHCPKINVRVSCEFSEFFCVPPGRAGRQRQSEAVVCASGNRTDETAVGIDGRAG